MERWISRLLTVILCGAVSLTAQTAQKPEGEKGDKAAEAEKKPEPKKPFADVVKDAKVIKGLFTIYRAEEQTYLEILPDQFDKMYLFSLTCDSGIGEGGLYAAASCGE